MQPQKLTAQKIQELLNQGWSVEKIKREFGGNKNRIRAIRDQSTPSTPSTPPTHSFVRVSELPDNFVSTNKVPHIPFNDEQKGILYHLSKNGHLSGKARKLMKDLWEGSL